MVVEHRERRRKNTPQAAAGPTGRISSDRRHRTMIVLVSTLPLWRSRSGAPARSRRGSRCPSPARNGALGS